MLCPNCGALLPDNAANCGQCGTPLSPAAPSRSGLTAMGGASRATPDAATVFEPLSLRTPAGTGSVAAPSGTQAPIGSAGATSGTAGAPSGARFPGSGEVHGWLVVTSGPDAGRDYRVSGPACRAILGSGEGPDVFTVRGPGVERLHACLVLGAEGLFLRDLDTPAGTLVGDRRVERAPVRDGDTIALGATTLFFRSLR